MLATYYIAVLCICILQGAYLVVAQAGSISQVPSGNGQGK